MNADNPLIVLCFSAILAVIIFEILIYTLTGSFFWG